MRDILIDIIRSWDPYSLFPFAPKDEYDFEINSLEFFLRDKKRTKLEIQAKIYELFPEEDIVNRKEFVSKIASKIYVQIK